MAGGGGQATFTAECSHTFHFSCISVSVAHGNLLCPLCNAQWRDLPFVRPTPVASPPPTHILRPRTHPVEPVIVFDDDEQVEPASAATDSREPSPAAAGASSNSNGVLVVKTHTEYSTVARDSSSENFAVLVHVKAPGIADAGAANDAQPRAPLDLVTVLDVSGSMGGHKLALLKQAMRFVIDNLGPADRLSVVSFSSEAGRVTKLARMTDAGKASCISAVESLVARGGTNIAEGLRTAAKRRGDRRGRERDGGGRGGGKTGGSGERGAVDRGGAGARAGGGAEDIAAARAAAERGVYQEAVEILENRQRAVAQSGDGDAVIVALGAEPREMRGRVSSQQNYAQSGRAYMLAGMSAHLQQRVNSSQMMQAQNRPVTLSYATPAMRAMLLRSREVSAELMRQQQLHLMRQQQQQQYQQQLLMQQQQHHLKAGEDAENSEPDVKKMRKT
ncbi:hypothetical protein QYE76_070877 [Lolium multiflorum]|uniref:VWFA domain-containing protein n=1 Tax=Lolium multiflorum TaxID=4521 RepID=A0AAD8WGA2_LOLMU|nr:hypothetical protein QYE76_070877 [Lolium multiflorum]